MRLALALTNIFPFRVDRLITHSLEHTHTHDLSKNAKKIIVFSTWTAFVSVFQLHEPFQKSGNFYPELYSKLWDSNSQPPHHGLIRWANIIREAWTFFHDLRNLFSFPALYVFFGGEGLVFLIFADWSNGNVEGFSSALLKKVPGVVLFIYLFFVVSCMAIMSFSF